MTALTPMVPMVPMEASKSSLSANASEWVQTELCPENESRALPLVTMPKSNKRRLKPTKAPRDDPDPLVMPRAQEKTTFLAPDRCVIFDRDGYKLFALENASDDDHGATDTNVTHNDAADNTVDDDTQNAVNTVDDTVQDTPHDTVQDMVQDTESKEDENGLNGSETQPNESPSTHTLNGDAAEFVPSTEFTESKVEDTAQTMESMESSLEEFVRTLLDDALVNGAMALEMEETVTTLICGERMADNDYFCAVFQAVLRGNTLRKVMIHEKGPEVTTALFCACNEAQKVALIQTLSPGDSILYVACHQFGSESLMAMVPTLSTTEQISYFIEALIRNMKTLGTDYYGVRLLNAYFEKGAVEGMMDMVFSIVEHIEVMARNEYGWYCYYHLLRSAAPASITDQIKKALYGKYADFCKGEYSAKVAEQCLRHSLADDEAERDIKGWAIVIMRDILGDSEALVGNKFGKNVFHLALLSKVKGEIGGLSDDLKALKERANDIYQRHVQRLRTEKAEKAKNTLNTVGAVSTATSAMATASEDVVIGNGLIGDVERTSDGTIDSKEEHKEDENKRDEDELDVDDLDAELDVIVQSAVTNHDLDAGHVLEFVGFNGFVDEEETA